MNLHKVLATKNLCYKTNEKIIVTGLMLHSTGANNPNLKRYVQPNDGLLGENLYNNSFNTARPGGREVCAHGFIGKLKDGTIASYQILPWNINGWHAGGSANKHYIGIEICEDGLGDKKYFDAVYKEAVELFAYLAKMYNITVTNKTVICHSEGHKLGIASGHGDVMHWFPKHGKSMDTFRADVKSELARLNKPATQNENTTQKAKYRVQVGAYAIKSNADKLISELDTKGFKNAYYIKSGALYRVYAGAFAAKANADAYVNSLKRVGFKNAFIVEI